MLWQAGLPDLWWPFALLMWITCRNAWDQHSDGNTPWEKRHNDAPDFQKYPFGALVLVRRTPKTEGRVLGKWEPRLSPHVLVGIDLCPGSLWARTYTVVCLNKLLDEDRASRVRVRRAADVARAAARIFGEEQARCMCVRRCRSKPCCTACVARQRRT